jgi:hypothetical protein
MIAILTGFFIFPSRLNSHELRKLCAAFYSNQYTGRLSGCDLTGWTTGAGEFISKDPMQVQYSILIPAFPCKEVHYEDPKRGAESV